MVIVQTLSEAEDDQELQRDVREMRQLLYGEDSNHLDE